ncbi:hypothetical protein [Pseudoduganella sp.]|uniref:hypothetical protein n=1 Tax=Pseudoduganella sp. TaxID=1880898 RepID=UPI0035ADA8AE
MKTLLSVIAAVALLGGSHWYLMNEPAFQSVKQALFDSRIGDQFAEGIHTLVIYRYSSKVFSSENEREQIVNGCRRYFLYAQGRREHRFLQVTMRLDVSNDRGWRIVSIRDADESEAACKPGLRSAYTAAQVRGWMDDLTTSPDSQQAALDKLSLLEGTGEGYLFRYLEDPRRLADRQLRFLNTRPGAVRPHYMVEASTVQEAMLRYLCWQSDVCNPQLPAGELVAARKQLLAYCRKDEACAARAMLHMVAAPDV